MMRSDEGFYAETFGVAAPVLYAYVSWVLEHAQLQNIKTLYFLARDGYIMKEIAEIICKQKKLEITCKYLCCSRYSLRMSSYHLIGEEAYDLLFCGGYRITPKLLLLRAALSEEQRKEIYIQIGMKRLHEDTPLSKQEFEIFAQLVAKNTLFREIVSNKSRQAFTNAAGYLKAQGLTKEEKIAIVDTGWTGSMQRTLRQLLEAIGAKPQITGFYFGMYENCGDSLDGKYTTFYFNRKSNPLRIARFNNNLFECFCAAPHGMTIGYSDDFQPIFKKQANFPVSLCLQIVAIKEFASSYDGTDLKRAFRKMRKLMCSPTKEQAEFYSDFSFCDDISESYLEPLVKQVSFKQVREYSFFKRIRKRNDSLFWACGSIAASEIPFSWYFKLNILLWDVIRAWRKRR